jgi:hypothetical protein
MAEVLIQKAGDALSQLIQLQAGRYDIRLAWTGRGTEDLEALVRTHAVKERLSKHLWAGLRDLLQMAELKELPEPVQVQIMSIVLKAQALNDLEASAHAQRLAAVKK